MPTKTVQRSWVKEFRKAVKTSTPKGWLVMQGKKEQTRVQIRKDGKKIADITIPYAWNELQWPDSLMRIKGAAKAYKESGQKLDLKTCFNIAHKVSSETEIDCAEALVACRKSEGKKVKDSNWENKYMPVLFDFKHETVDGRRKYKKDSQGKKIPCSPCNIERIAKNIPTVKLFAKEH